MQAQQTAMTESQEMMNQSQTTNEVTEDDLSNVGV
jgi:hypothetical protein